MCNDERLFPVILIADIILYRLLFAYLSAVCLQRELDDAHREYGSEKYDILSFYEWDDLQKMNLAVKAAEDHLVRFIVGSGGVIKRYSTFEEFPTSAWAW